MLHEDGLPRKIYDRMIHSNRGKAFVIGDFLDLGDYTAIQRALHRLSASGKIRAILRGVYHCPRYNTLLKDWEAVDPTEVAKALARKFNWRITPSGNEALNLLGLDTQVPAHWVFVSDGPSRSFKMGNITLEFRHRMLREHTSKSPKANLLTQALSALGKDELSPEQLALLQRQLSEEEKAAFLRDTRHSKIKLHNLAKTLKAQP